MPLNRLNILFGTVDVAATRGLLRQFLVLLTLLWPLGVKAVVLPLSLNSHTFSPPAKWLPADTLRDTLPAAFAGLKCHLRLQTSRSGDFDAAIIYDRVDSLNYMKCRAWRSAVATADELMADPISLECIRCINGEESLVASTVINKGLSPGARDYSIELSAQENGAMVSCGDACACGSMLIPYRGLGGSVIEFITGRDCRIVRYSTAVEAADAPQFAPYANVASLLEAISKSSDACQSVWVPFDRYTNANTTAVGGAYRLATVADGANGYMIVYIDGAETCRDSWTPLRIKGYLYPTGFIGHYDLVWFDPWGRRFDHLTHAEFDSNNSTLSITIPSHGAKLRFRQALP